MVIWRMAFIKRPWIESFCIRNMTCIHLTKTAPHCLEAQQRKWCTKSTASKLASTDLTLFPEIIEIHRNFVSIGINMFQKYILLYSWKLPNHKWYNLAYSLISDPLLPLPFLVLLPYLSDWSQKGEVNNKSPLPPGVNTQDTVRTKCMGRWGELRSATLGEEMVFCSGKAEKPCHRV